MKGLFGEMPIPVAVKGHAYAPGSGPEGSTCKTCRHRVRVRYTAKTYSKCGLVRHLWTHGPGSDIRCKDLACKGYEPGDSGREDHG